MNKLAKGAIALGAGAVLLGGGLGTLALWNDSAEIDAGTVGSGVMTIEATPGAWSPEIALWVPGDNSVYSAPLDITLGGTNLVSTLTVDAGSITGDTALLDALDITLVPGTAPSGLTVTAAGPNTFTLTSDTPDVSTNFSLPVTVTVDFPEDSVTGTTAQTEVVDLSALTFVLQQVAP